MAKYKKKPIVIEARKLEFSNLSDICEWSGGTIWSKSPMRKVTGITINTLEGDMNGEFGDYIIKGIKGEFYPCKPDIFEASYDEVIED